MDPRPSSGAFVTFAIFALVGPVFGAFLLFLPNAINVFRWIAQDSTYLSGLLGSIFYIYPFGIWPGLIAGGLVVWRDRTSGGSTILFAAAAGAIGGVIWIAAFELFVFRLGTQYLFSEINLYRAAICAAAAMACWRLSRAPAKDFARR
jgi:hypothetical protein